MNAATVAKALEGRRLGEGQGWIAHCPVSSHGRGRGDRNRSLSLIDGEGGRLVVHCFARCSPLDILDELRRRGLHDDRPAFRRRDLTPRVCAKPPPVQVRPDPEAFALWRSAEPPEGTLGERYLADWRGLLPPYPPSLRFLPAALHKPSSLHMPALVAAVSGADRRIIAVQLTYLRANDGQKAAVEKPRWTFGSLGDGAIRLAKAGEVLGLAEGTEDALSAISLTGVPCWASLGSSRMDNVAVPDEVRELHLFVDDDKSGRDGAEKTAERHIAEGRWVVLRLPPDGFKDWNDVAMEAALP